MNANSFGNIFRITTFGESHGPAMGVVIDGCPSGLTLDESRIQECLDRRRPGQNDSVSGRNEPDKLKILSGVYQGKTLGTPIAMMVESQNARSQDYAAISANPRAGHADDVWKNKFAHVDPRGGGRSSGRETVARVMAGSVAEQLVKSMVPELSVLGSAIQIGKIQVAPNVLTDPRSIPNDVKIYLQDLKENGDSVGGKILIVATAMPQGLGSPIFKKLKSEIGGGLLSIGAVNGVEFGAGFEAADRQGTEFHMDKGSAVYGGQRGGISTGEPLSITVSIKPTSSILDVAKKGRHDPCIVPRAISVCESMIWLVLADQMLARRLDNL
jgi:chorismate synthase